MHPTFTALVFRSYSLGKVFEGLRTSHWVSGLLQTMPAFGPINKAEGSLPFCRHSSAGPVLEVRKPLTSPDGASHKGERWSLMEPGAVFRGRGQSFNSQE